MSVVIVASGVIYSLTSSIIGVDEGTQIYRVTVPSAGLVDIQFFATRDVPYLSNYSIISITKV